MKKKHWKVSVFDKTSEIVRDDTFYVTDTEGYLTFELIDEDFTPDSASVTVYNTYGKVTIHVTNMEVVDGIVSYKIPVEAIRHSGDWRTQVVFTKENEDYTTKIIEFDVGGHLLGNKKPPIVVIENWNHFIKHGERLIDDWKQLEKIRQTNERQRERSETVRQTEFETNETERQNEFESNEVERESAFEERYGQLEEEYAPKLTEVTTQLAQKANQVDVRLKSENIGLNDADSEMIAAIEGGEGTTFELLSIPRDKSVTEEKTTFIETSTNLLDVNSLKSGYTIDGATGEEVSISLNNVSDFKVIEPNENYTIADIARRSFYDVDEVFISSTTGGGTFTPPTNAYYVKWVVHNNYLDTAQINKGSTLLDYEPYYSPRFTKESGLGDSGIIEEKSITSKELANNAVGIEQVNFVKYSSNLVDVNSLIPGYSIDGSTGEPIANSVNGITEFEEVEANADYYLVDIARHAFYDKDKNFITSSSGGGVKTTTTDTYYARWAVNNRRWDTAQINKGSTLLDYEPYYVRLDGISVSPNDSDIVTENHFVKGLINDEVYTAPLQSDVSMDSPDNLKELLYTDVYAMYDELVTNYSSYVTKELLGTEDTGKELYRYDFIPPQTDVSGVDIPKIFITAGQHGSEKTGVWVALQTAKQLCEAWDSQESLENLRWNVHLIIIPITNPWGWEYISEGSGNKTGTRKNSNGVDIARNFPTGWVEGSDPTAATYGGTAPLSEPEAQYANAILESEKDNLIYVCDFHNFFTRDRSIWNAAATNYQINLGENLVRHMSRKWKKEHTEFMPQDETTMVGYADMGAPNGSLGKHATSLGIHGGTFEVSEYNPWEADGTGAGNSPLTIKFGMDAFVNWLNLVVKNSIIHLD